MPTFMLEIFLFLIQFSVSHFSLYPQKIQLLFPYFAEIKKCRKTACVAQTDPDGPGWTQKDLVGPILLILN